MPRTTKDSKGFLLQAFLNRFRLKIAGIRNSSVFGALPSSKYFLNYFSTPLHYAASYGYLDVVELLVENEASTKIKDYYGNDPHDLALAFGYIKVAQFLQSN